MSQFKPGDKVTPINVDRYHDIMKQLVGKTLLVRSVGNDKNGDEIVCAGVPGEEDWYWMADDLRLVSAWSAGPFQPEPTDILKCDLCFADAGDDPYHATMDENGHVHICHDCFDPQQHDVGVAKQQRDELLAALQDALGDLEYLKNAPDSAYARPDDETIKAVRAAIAKAGGEV